ncbi:MAG: hypothetical protein ACKOA8_19345 [Deltaproteobacteria bacterium]
MGDSRVSDFINFVPRSVKIKIGGIVFGSILIVTLTFISLSTVWELYRGNETPKPEETHRETTSSHPHEETSNPYEIKGISVGFMDKKDARMAYAQFTLIFNCPTEACKKNLTLHHAKVLDTVFEVSSEFYIEDFSQPNVTKGFARFKSKISEELSKKFASLSPSEISIQDWFMK